MSSPSLGRVDNEIFDALNAALHSQKALSEFEVAKIKRQASKLQKPYSLACLAALYAHLGNVEATNSCAYEAIEYRDIYVVKNVIAALNNIRQRETICDIALNNYDWLFNYESCLYSFYESAIFTVNLELCNMIKNYIDSNSHFNIDVGRHIVLESFINSSRNANFMTEYVKYALDAFVSKFKKQREYSLNLEVMKDEGVEFLSVTLLLSDIEIDELIDLEFEWHDLISHFDGDADLKSKVSFVLQEVEE
ncbi:TPA: hypothetical protein ACX6QL_003332 [Photobacterium damselae]